MKITQVKLENYTLFKECRFDFGDGINIIIGENGTGKTHLMKLLYAATQANSGKVSFADKLVNTMLPDDYSISKLVSKGVRDAQTSIQVSAKDKDSRTRNLTLKFDAKTKKKAGIIGGDNGWETSFVEDSSIFIPAKEILSNSYNLSAAVAKEIIKFDDTYVDILNSAKVDKLNDFDADERRKILTKVEKAIGGKVIYDTKKDSFYLKSGNSKQEFNLISEGIRKLALVWQLVNNGMLESNSVLFWDEPEVNMNPSFIPLIADLLLELSRSGVQVFVATHDYFLSKYIDARKQSTDNVNYYSLSKVNENVVIEMEKKFNLLEKNDILNAARRLYREEIGVN